jgi:hypothetical protein
MMAEYKTTGEAVAPPNHRISLWGQESSFMINHVGFSGHVGSGRSRPLRSRPQRRPRPFTALCTYSALIALLSRFFSLLHVNHHLLFPTNQPKARPSDILCFPPLTCPFPDSKAARRRIMARKPVANVAVSCRSRIAPRGKG